MKHLAEKEPPSEKTLFEQHRMMLAWNSSGPCKETKEDHIFCSWNAPIQVLSQLIFRGNTTHTHTHPPHHRTPSFSNYSLDDEVNLIHLVTLAKLLAGDSQHQQGEVLNQSWTALDCKHSQREGGSAPLEARGDGSGMLSAGHGASAADTVVSTVSFCLGFVQGLYFAELLCISFLSCNLSL